MALVKESFGPEIHASQGLRRLPALARAGGGPTRSIFTNSPPPTPYTTRNTRTIVVIIQVRRTPYSVVLQTLLKKQSITRTSALLTVNEPHWTDMLTIKQGSTWPTRAARFVLSINPRPAALALDADMHVGNTAYICLRQLYGVVFQGQNSVIASNDLLLTCGDHETCRLFRNNSK
jgi:hypothetical protein